MLTIRAEFEASVSEQRTTCHEIVCYEAIFPPFETSFQVTTCPTGSRRNLRLPDCVRNSRRHFQKTGDLAVLLYGSTSWARVVEISFPNPFFGNSRLRSAGLRCRETLTEAHETRRYPPPVTLVGLRATAGPDTFQLRLRGNVRGV